MADRFGSERVRALVLALLLLGACAPAERMPDASGGEDAGVPDMSFPGPLLLSQTGLYSDFASRTIDPSLFHFTTRYPLWSDGAEKERYLLLPGSSQIDTSDMDRWVFPVGTKAWKEFRFDGRLIETRLIEKVQEGPDGWIKIAYAWREDGSDADAVPDGRPNALGSGHDVPAQFDCEGCHNSTHDGLIGVSAIQLSQADNSGALSALGAAHRLTAPPASEFSPPGSGVVQDALGYLHGNCGHCHRPEAAFTKYVHLEMRLLVSDATPEETATYRTAINNQAMHIYPPDVGSDVVPGDPDKSQLYVRMGLRDYWAMPPICTKVVDDAGRTTIAAWILSL